MSYKDIKETLEREVKINDSDKRTMHTLNVGCGNSKLSEHMAEDGYQHVLAIDYSNVVIDKMNSIYADRPRLRCMFLWERRQNH
jgi:2-polyprenyl-3-methyl-5-hydroxy-6-metoxy-1,4-benzoquinol methylase